MAMIDGFLDDQRHAMMEPYDDVEYLAALLSALEK